MGILDKIVDNNLAEVLHEFKANELVTKILAKLDTRERSILTSRFGLLGVNVRTLEVIGKDHNLTRERVRQIEKVSVKHLRENLDSEAEFKNLKNYISTLVNDHGGIMTEESFFSVFRLETEEEKNSLLFLLHLAPELRNHSTDEHINSAWVTDRFDKALIHKFLIKVQDILKEHGKPISEDELTKRIEAIFETASEFSTFNVKSLKNLIHSSKHVKRNTFGEYGLLHWNEIQPKDVGDKAYLALKHHGKPEHYSVITEFINKHKFDNRTAYKETVHNELIKDKRFVLVGRGIYALSEWGYKTGVVADVITDILKAKGAPMTRDEIVEEVSKKRMVKSNTILVGLSNKKLFKKVGKNLYYLADTV